MGGVEGSSSSPEGSSGGGGRGGGGGDGGGGGGDGGGGGGITEYERRRLWRIRENRERLEALGLPHLASAALSPPPPPSSPSSKQQREKRRRRRRGGGESDEDDDEEYRPSHGDHGGDDDDEVEGRDGSSSSSSSSSYSAGEEEEEEEEVRGSSRGSKRKGKKKNLSNSKKGCKRSCVKGNIEKPDDFVDEDTALEQAIALSLGVAENSAVSGRLSQKSGTKESETGGKRKNRKLFKSRVQLSEDEVIGYFFLFDEVGNGHISVRDLQRMALAHDFSWTDSEIAAMVHLFDTDGDRKLSLDDFRTIVSRCNMMQHDA